MVHCCITDFELFYLLDLLVNFYLLPWVILFVQTWNDFDLLSNLLSLIN